MHFFEPLLCTFYLTNTFNLEYDRAVEMFEKAIRNKCYVQPTALPKSTFYANP